MMNEKKMTKRDHFNALLAISEVANNPSLVDFINHELELLERKNSALKKPTAKQEANKDIKAAILDAMEDEKLYTISDMMKEIGVLEGLSNQRVSALVRQLKLEGAIVRTEDKRKAYFSKA